MIRLWLGLSASLVLSTFAQDGGQLYETYCGACHAPNGEGATGGQFPPLAGSEWVEGSAERAIQIVLHGMQGPVEVKGKAYNLIMPPQGMVLPDDQIAAILTHVRSSWGNTGDKVTPQMVKQARAATADRKIPWTAPEILKLYPLPKEESPLRNLTSRIYHGSWKKLPKFEELEARNVEEEASGIISLKQADRKDHFGMVWEADFMAPEDGEYYFRFACDDGGRVLIDNEVVLEVHGLGPMSGGRTVACKLDFKKGAHPMRVEYYELTGQEGIGLAWMGPSDKVLKQLTDTTISKNTGGPEPIPIEPTAGRAAIYRNFIADTTPRAIGIGFQGGINLAYSADHLAPELIWTGDFMDGGRHWTNRGQGNQPPAGEQVVKLSGKPILPEGARSRGYQLDAVGNPTFHSTLGDLKLSDAFQASDGKLIRTLSLNGDGDPLPIFISEAQKDSRVNGSAKLLIQPDGSTVTQLTGTMTLGIRDTVGLSITASSLLEKDKDLYIVLSPGEFATLTYSWK